MNYKALTFGPMLVRFDDVDPELINKTLEYAEINEDQMDDMRKNLAGKLQYEREFLYEDCLKLSPLLQPYIEKYLETIVDRLDDRMDWSEVLDGNWEVQWSSFWINKQKAGEYNPIHSHAGDVSFVYYPYVDERIKDEKTISNGNDPGTISFMSQIPYGYKEDVGNVNNIGTWRNALNPIFAYQFKPKTGMLFMFPSYLDHAVDAFYGDYDRFSVSGNFFLARKENNES